MHSHDPNKSDAAFQKEFERILQEAGEGSADFTGFVFPSSGYDDRTFVAKCSFSGAKFTQDANFSGARFTQDADFRGARFTQAAHFIDGKFTQAADFGGARFPQEANFTGARFTQEANFIGTQFTQHAKFFSARFTRSAILVGAEFAQDAGFLGAKFTQDAHFSYATFARLADFREARFEGVVEFKATKFREGARGDDKQPGPVFAGTQFEKPERVTFYQTYLGQALFHNCDVSKMSFCDVRWRKRGNGKSMVLDEDIDLPDEPQAASPERALRASEGDPSPRNYRLIAELYQQLKKNYDDRRDYWTAGDFHYGEMEMKRLRSDSHKKIVRWWHSHAGLVALYKYASEYGESYVRPALWLVLVLFAFMFLHPVTGLHLDAGRSSTPAAASGAESLTYWRPLQDSGDVRSVWRARRDLVGHSLMTTLYVAAFQKDLTYQPSYPRGRLLALAEVLLTSTLGALFLLAVRRQFKR